MNIAADSKRTLKNDGLLVLLVLLAAFTIWFFFHIRETDGTKVVIWYKSEVYKTVPLSKNDRIVFDQDGETNVIVVQDKEVYMESANCPDKICVQHRHIRHSGESIVCLPHRIIVEIQSEDEKTKEPEVDAVAK